MFGAGLESMKAVDICRYVLAEYVPAKPMESNLNVLFASEDQKVHARQSEACGQLNCGARLKFPFARLACSPTAVSIQKATELVSADATTETKRVVELTLDVAALGELDYEPGDTVSILPGNPPDIVNQLLQRLDLSQQADSDCYVTLALNCAKKSIKVPAYIPLKTSPREIFTLCLSLQSVPQKQFLSALASFTSDKEERAFLACLSSKQGSAHYQTLFLERGLALLDLLELCASCKPSLAFLVEHLPRLFPRPYSIANSPLELENQLRIIYSVRARNPGITTGMIESKIRHLPSKLFVYPRLRNSFCYTDRDIGSNQILIAVGTGLAPFLGFLAHKQQHQHLPKGQTWLYVGAKTPQAILKQEQLLNWQQSAVLQRLRMCYSRSLVSDTPKYVQHLLEEDAEDLVKFLLKPTTVLYVCADGAKISKSIDGGLRHCLQLVLNLEETEATQLLNEQRKQGKYREDVWI